MANVLVTGGAGYVGAHCCLALAHAGHKVVVYDNLSNGHRSFVRWGALEEGDLRDRARLDSVLAAHRPDVVVHCAGLIEVGVSVQSPSEFYDVNVAGGLNLLDAMRRHDVGKFVFSSTCSVYGAPEVTPMNERHRIAPLNPYAWNKLMVEQAAQDYARAYGLKFAILRYFNASGAAPEHGIGEKHDPETHALPLALFAAMGRRESFSLFGDDYDTRDGSCVRDYVHVLDLADAHVRAVARLLSGGDNLIANLGTGDGVSVLELVAAIERVTELKVPLKRAARRAGDSPALVADTGLARAALGWAPVRGVEASIASAYVWHSEAEPKLFPPRAG